MAQFACGCRFLLEEWADRVDPAITVEKIQEFVLRWQPYLKNAGVEAVGLQKTLNSWLESMRQEGKLPSYLNIHKLEPGGRHKDARIDSQIMPVKNGQWHKRPAMAKNDQVQNLLWELELHPY